MSEERRKAGRPCMYTPERHRIAIEALRRGNTYEDAAAMAGVSEGALMSWKRKFPAFREDCGKATAHVADELVTKITTSEDYASIRWWLERRRREFQPPKDRAPEPTDDEDDGDDATDEEIEEALRG